MARRGQEAGLDRIRGFRLPFGLLQRRGSQASLGDVGQGSDDALHAAILGAGVSGYLYDQSQRSQCGYRGRGRQYIGSNCY